MSQEITLQSLIDKVKQDLFSPYGGTKNEGKQVYPIFFVDQVELEVAVNLTYDAEAGLKITIPQIFEGSVTAGQGKEAAHTMKLSLSPIMTRDEMRKLAMEDEMLWKGIETATAMSIRKGGKLAGEE